MQAQPEPDEINSATPFLKSLTHSLTMKMLSELTRIRLKWLFNVASAKNNRVSYNIHGIKPGFQVHIIRKIKFGTLFTISDITPDTSNSVWSYTFILLENVIAEQIPIYPVKMRMCEIGNVDLITWSDSDDVKEFLTPTPQYDSSLELIRTKMRDLWDAQSLPLNLV